MTRLVLHIDRVVIAGRADPDAVAGALRAALMRELARPGMAQQVAAHDARDVVDAGTVPAGSSPVALAEAVVRSVTGGTR